MSEFDGQRPDEEVGPDECESDVKRTEYRLGERSGGVEQSEVEATDEVHEQFPIEPIAVVADPTDGMPVPVTGDIQASQAPAFTYDNVVCLEDDRKYVELFAEELMGRGWRYDGTTGWSPPGICGVTTTSGNRGYEAISAAMDGFEVLVRSRFSDDGTSNERREFSPDEVEHVWGTSLVMSDEGSDWVPVRPQRERCEYYRRQVFSNDDEPDQTKVGHQLVFRNCTARMSNGGAFMSLRDEAVYMCDYRDPPDPKTAKHQDDIDRSKLVDRPDLLRLPLFNTEGDAVQVEEKS